MQLALEVAPMLFVVLLAPHGVQFRLGEVALPAAAQKPWAQAWHDGPPWPAAQIDTAE